METKKKTTISVETTNGKEVKNGDVVVFSSAGESLIGIFEGLDNRGNWKFGGIEPFGNKVFFCKAPRSIQEMFLIEDVNINNLPFMNLPIESEE